VSVQWLIIFATLREAAITIQAVEADKVGPDRYLFSGGEILICGMGLEAASRSVSRAPAVGYQWLNVGLAGSIDPLLAVGAVCSIGRVGLLRADESGRFVADKGSFSLGSYVTTLYSSQKPVYTRPEVSAKDTLVDMEGYAIARVAQEKGVPLIMRKVVSDDCSNTSHAKILANIDRLSWRMAEEVVVETRVATYLTRNVLLDCDSAACAAQRMSL
jgi:hypothetical protein